MAEPGRMRLHITPFNAELLDRFIPPSLKPQATNISFHTLETFPERGFGYVDLPVMEAQKLKGKFNGTTLKGAKVKIEEAKPEKKRKVSEPVEDEDEEKKIRKRARKEKRKLENGVLPGHELEAGRHVKRGWSEDTKKAKKSNKAGEDSLEDKKMRFKTEVPLNKLAIEDKPKKSKSKDKEKESKRGKKAAIVKEFSKTTKPSTTGALKGNKAVSYTDGKGWLDEDGNVVEEEPQSRRRTRSSKQQPPVPEPTTKSEPTSSSQAESTDDEELSSSDIESEASTEVSSISEDEDALERQLSEAKSNTATNAQVERERQKSTPVGDAIPSLETPKEVHPLEALFKRPPPTSDITDTSPKSKRPTPINTSFSFFNSGGEEDKDTEMANVPQTPHTKQDLEWRSIRSAAPTPDTAAIGKRFNFSFDEQDAESEEGDEDIEQDTPMADVNQAQPGAQQKGAEGEKEESEFRKWFYDNRGDLNRAWKKRRREEKKVVRQRENRRLNRRIA